MADDSEDADRTPDGDDVDASGSDESAADSETVGSPAGSEVDGPSADAGADKRDEPSGERSEPVEESDESAGGSDESADSDSGDRDSEDLSDDSDEAEATDEPTEGETGDEADDDSAADDDSVTGDTNIDDSSDEDDANEDETDEGDTDGSSDESDTDEPGEDDDSDESAADGEDADRPEESDSGALENLDASADDEATVTGTDGGAPGTASDAFTDEPATESPGSDPLVADEDETGILSDGPETDEEMPLADHIEEMIRRLAVVLGIGGLITLLLYPGADLVNSAFGLDLVSSTEVIDFLWNKHIPGAPEMVDRRPRVYGPLELLLTELKVAALGGLVIGLPAFVYETYLFMRPGLYSKERRYYLAAVPTSLVLALVGIAFAHFLVLPAIFAYFTSYTTGTAVVAFGLQETFNLILILMGYNAVIFQIPLFVMLAIMMNLVTRRWLEDRRLLFWGTFLGLAFLVSPDPTGMAPIIIALTMIALFEGTLFVLRWTGRGSLAPTADGLAARRPQAAVLAALVGYLLSPLPAPTGYYDLLPSVVVETLAANGLAVYTPLIIAGVLVGVFELVSLLLRRYGRSRRMLRVSLAVDTARRPVWLVAVVVGYLGSPDPAVLRWATELNLHPALAGGIAVGLVLGYEALRLLLASREDRAG